MRGESSVRGPLHTLPAPFARVVLGCRLGVGFVQWEVCAVPAWTGVREKGGPQSVDVRAGAILSLGPRL